jgi:hypothetical protein
MATRNSELSFPPIVFPSLGRSDHNFGPKTVPIEKLDPDENPNEDDYAWVLCAVELSPLREGNILPSLESASAECHPQVFSSLEAASASGFGYILDCRDSQFGEFSDTIKDIYEEYETWEDQFTELWYLCEENDLFYWNGMVRYPLIFQRVIQDRILEGSIDEKVNSLI